MGVRLNESQAEISRFRIECSTKSTKYGCHALLIDVFVEDYKAFHVIELAEIANKDINAKTAGSQTTLSRLRRVLVLVRRA